MTEGVALVDELGNITVMQSSGDEQDEVVDHVRVGEIVQKGAKRLCSLRANEAKLLDKFLGGVFDDGFRLQRRRFVLQEVAVISCLIFSLRTKQSVAECTATAWSDGMHKVDGTKETESVYIDNIPKDAFSHLQDSRIG